MVQIEAQTIGLPLSKKILTIFICTDQTGADRQGNIVRQTIDTQIYTVWIHHRAEINRCRTVILMDVCTPDSRTVPVMVAQLLQHPQQQKRRNPLLPVVGAVDKYFFITLSPSDTGDFLPQDAVSDGEYLKERIFAL